MQLVWWRPGCDPGAIPETARIAFWGPLLGAGGRLTRPELQKSIVEALEAVSGATRKGVSDPNPQKPPENTPCRQ